MDNYLQVSFLPWAGFRKNIKVGPIVFWPYDMEANQRISDLKVKKYLDKYFRAYIDHDGKPVKTIIICSYKNSDFHILTRSERDKIKNAANVLIFASIIPQVIRAVNGNNRGLGPPSADVFELVTQNFCLSDDSISVRAGATINGGWKLGKISFHKPWATGGALWNIDEKLVNRFSKCFSSRVPREVRERLFRALEWFRLAHIEDDRVSTLSKVVMMATAFEILLQFPKSNKSEFFANYVQANISSYKLITKNKKYTRSLAAWWAWNFYQLRNKIVHGDLISLKGLIYKKWFTHLIVADLAFWECLMLEFIKYKCTSKDIYSAQIKLNKISLNSSQPASINQLAKTLFDFNDIHRTLGWAYKRKFPVAKFYNCYIK